jgi:hypothetical protein
MTWMSSSRFSGKGSLQTEVDVLPSRSIAASATCILLQTWRLTPANSVYQAANPAAVIAAAIRLCTLDPSSPRARRSVFQLELSAQSSNQRFRRFIEKKEIKRKKEENRALPPKRALCGRHGRTSWSGNRFPPSVSTLSLRLFCFQVSPSFFVLWRPICPDAVSAVESRAACCTGALLLAMTGITHTFDGNMGCTTSMPDAEPAAAPCAAGRVAPYLADQLGAVHLERSIHNGRARHDATHLSGEHHRR